jgi:AAA domain, putative AbiEii toxin, Type IV TA system
VQFLSSQQGQSSLASVKKQVTEYLGKLTSRLIPLRLTITPRGQITGHDQLGQLCVSALENRTSPRKALFTYFPADRTLPNGEIAVQLGSADAMQQIQSHMGTPQNKYHRLKQVVITSLIGLGGDSAPLKAEFQRIFDNLLPGRELAKVTIAANGLVKVFVKDQGTGREFDIDGMSSGEKGLILGFLIARNTMNKGAVILFDEPELHLNQAVCRNILPFIKQHLVIDFSAQAFICTHSPEIVAAAYGATDCNLIHLRSGSDASPIHERDQGEVFEVLDRLGSTTADVLFWKGTIAVEGEHDAEILGEGFFDTLSHYKLIDLGGRREVEKEIRRLQELEKEGQVQKVQGRRCFIFDHDGQPSSLTSSEFVKLAQWERYCIENYLTNEVILYDVLSEHVPDKTNLGSRGEFEKELKGLAVGQLVARVARQVYQEREPVDLGWRPGAVVGKTYKEIGGDLSDRLSAVATTLSGFEKIKWIEEFERDCRTRDAQLRPEWESAWKIKSSGKQLFKDIYPRWKVHVSQLVLKKALIRRHRTEKSPEWKEMESVIGTLIS